MHTSTARRPRRTALIGIIAAGALVAACTTTDSSGDPTPSNTTAAPTTTVVSSTGPTISSRTTTSAPTPTVSASTRAKAQAVQTVRKYYALTDAVQTDPSRPIGVLHSVLNTFLYGAESQDIAQNRARGWKISGTTRIVYARATSASIPRLTGTATVTVKSCVDVSHTEVTDSNGKVVVHHTESTIYGAETDVVTNVHYPRGTWVITNSTNQFVKSC